jgi:hypothetical protein
MTEDETELSVSSMLRAVRGRTLSPEANDPSPFRFTVDDLLSSSSSNSSTFALMSELCITTPREEMPASSLPFEVLPDDDQQVPEAMELPSALSTSRVRRWCFTLFSVSDDVAALQSCLVVQDAIRFFVYQVERCPNAKKNGQVWSEAYVGRPHAQGYIELFESTRMLAVKRLFQGESFQKRVHLEVARENAGTNINYCKKEKNPDGSPARWPGCTPVTCGTPARSNGKSDDDHPKKASNFDIAVHLIHAGTTLEDMETKAEYAHLRPTCARNRKQLLETALAFVRRSLPPVRNVWFEVWYGPPGTGKSYDTVTSWPVHHHQCVFRMTNTKGCWFDGYEGQPVLIVDDFYDWLEPGFVLQITDKYQLAVPIKGGFVQSRWVHVRFISNFPVEQWWSYASTTAQGKPGKCTTQQFEALKSRLKGFHPSRVKYVDGPDRRKGDDETKPYPKQKNDDVQQ